MTKKDKSEKQWSNLYSNYVKKYTKANRVEQGFHLLETQFTKEEFIDFYCIARTNYESGGVTKKLTLDNVIKIQRRAVDTRYKVVKDADGNVMYDADGKPILKLIGQRAMVNKLKKLRKGLESNPNTKAFKEAKAEFDFIKANPAIRDTLETYTGTTLFDEDWIEYFNRHIDLSWNRKGVNGLFVDNFVRNADDEQYANWKKSPRENPFAVQGANVNQATFADNLDAYLESYGLEKTAKNYAKARELFESALY